MVNASVFHEEDVDDEDELEDGKEDVVDFQKDATDFSEFSSSPAEEATPKQQIQDYDAFSLVIRIMIPTSKEITVMLLLKNATARQNPMANGPYLVQPRYSLHADTKTTFIYFAT
jgi:hypothetical protein